MAAGLPTSTLIEVQLNSVWTDITSLVGSWSVRRGGRQPGTLTLDLDNADGRFMPDNATSAYYPYFVEGAAVRVTVTKSASSSVRFFGWLSEIVPSYPSEPSHSRVQATAVDKLGVLARTTLKPYPRRAVEGSAAVLGYYPLTDRAARFGASDVKGALPDMTVRVLSTGGSCDFAADDSFAEDVEPCVTMTSGRGLWHSREVLSAAGAWAIHLLVRVQANSAGTVLRLFATGVAADTTVAWDGTSTFTLTAPGGTATVTGVDPDRWHYLSVLAPTARTATTMYVDEAGNSVVSANASIYVGVALGGDLTMSARDLAVGTPGTALVPPQRGYLGSVGLGANGIGGGASIDYGFDWSGLGNPAPNSATSNSMGGSTELDAVLAAADSQAAGVIYSTYTSTTSLPIALTNEDCRPTTVALTIDAEADMSGEPELMRGLGEATGLVTVSSATGDVTTTASSGAFGDTSVEVRTFLLNDSDKLAKAQDVLAQSNNVRLRLTSVTLDLVTAANDRYAAFFLTTPGERVRLTNLPSTYFGVTYIDGYVDGWEERGSATGYEVTFDLSPADAPSEGIWDDSTYGRWGFGDGVATNSSSATVGATSVAFQWTGGLTLSTSAGDYPLDLDWNGERVTVTAAPAGGSSPQTLSLTRGVAPTVARAHNAGEPVDIWNAARWAM